MFSAAALLQQALEHAPALQAASLTVAAAPEARAPAAAPATSDAEAEAEAAAEPFITLDELIGVSAVQ